MCEARFRVFSAVAVGLVFMAFGSSQGAIVTLQAGAGGQPAEIIQEAMLIQPNPNDNFGGRGSFEAGEDWDPSHWSRMSVMRFNVTDPSLGLYDGGTPQFYRINSITLSLTPTGVSENPGNMDLRVAAGTESQGDWVEGTGISASVPDVWPNEDTGQVTYSERREGQSTPWSPSGYPGGTGDGVLGSISGASWPGAGVRFGISFSPLPGETLTDLVDRWATGNNEGVLINDVNRTGEARWAMFSSEYGTIADRPALTIDYMPIPEPSTLAIWALGLLGLGFYGWRRRK